MTKTNTNSRLAETDFSQYNLRDAYITDQAEYLAMLRDEAMFSNWGISVLVRIPADENGNILENNVDEYSNFVDIYWIDTTETVIPKFTEYRQNVSDHGMSADGTDGLYPLEVLIPSKLHLMRNARIIFNEYDSAQQKIAREWVVLGTVQKQLSGSKTYTRIANCVPAREETYNNTETALGTIWFDYNQDYLINYNNIRAQGRIWYIRHLVDNSKIKKIFRDTIWEQVPDYPIYEEEVNVLVYYDTRAKNIIDGGTGFSIGQIYKIYDKVGNQIYITLDESNTTEVPLELEITGVSETGVITSFNLNVTRGYTDFSENENGLEITLASPTGQDATILLPVISWDGDLIQEDVVVNEIKGTKYLKPEGNRTVFSAKSLAISVLN